MADAREGAGGNIQIVADNFLASPDSVVDASSDLGIDGVVQIEAPDVDLAGGLVVLDARLLDAAAQLRGRCGARRDIGASSFVGVGRGGLPASPDGPLASAYLAAAPPGGRPPGLASVAGSSRRVALAASCRGAP